MVEKRLFFLALIHISSQLQGLMGLTKISYDSCVYHKDHVTSATVCLSGALAQRNKLHPALATQIVLVRRIWSGFWAFIRGLLMIRKIQNDSSILQRKQGLTAVYESRLILHSLYKNSTYSVTVHISAVAVFEQKGVVSNQQCIDQTAFQPVVHLYFTSLRLVQQPTPLASYTTAFTSPAFANKYTTAYTVISGVCLQLVHFHSPTLSRGKKNG